MAWEPNSAQSSSGSMTDAQKAKIVAWLIEKWGKGNPQGIPRCEKCNHPQMTWSVGQDIITALIFANGSVNVGGTLYPVISIMCSNCGNTHYVNAIISGIIDANPGKGDSG